MSIPKVIHYCWFGGNPLSPTVQKCIASWKKYCPDYQIIRWDENNFDISQHPYMQEAYDRRKWAFLTDIARLMIVYEHGGIYLDTDVELLKPLDSLLDYSGFLGFEGKLVCTGLGFGAEPHNPVVKAMLDGYDGAHFLKEDGTMNCLVCTRRNTVDLEKLGLRADGSYQVIDGVHFLPSEYLCPMDWKTKEFVHFTDNTISIHHYDASWKTWYRKLVDGKVPDSLFRKMLYYSVKKMYKIRDQYLRH